MNKLALGFALGLCLASSAAVAADRRPTYLAFKAPAASSSPVVAPAAPQVKKRQAGIGSVPLIVPLVGAIAVIGVIAGVATGSDDDSSPG